MKKYAATMIAFVMMMTMVSAFAATEINWADLETEGAELIEKGEFVSFEEAGVKIWLPTDLNSDEITEEIRAQGFLGYYVDETAGAISIRDASATAATLEEYKTLAEETGMADIEDVVVNGLTAFSFVEPEYNMPFIIYEIPNGFLLEINAYAVPDSGLEAIVQFVAASVTAE